MIPVWKNRENMSEKGSFCLEISIISLILMIWSTFLWRVWMFATQRKWTAGEKRWKRWRPTLAFFCHSSYFRFSSFLIRKMNIKHNSTEKRQLKKRPLRERIVWLYFCLWFTRRTYALADKVIHIDSSLHNVKSIIVCIFIHICWITAIFWYSTITDGIWLGTTPFWIILRHLIGISFFSVSPHCSLDFISFFPL